MRTTALAITFVLCCSAFGQQPNTAAASLLANGVDGPPFPIVATVERNNPATALIQGSSNAPFAIVQSATGQLQAGAATTSAGIFDLPLSPEPFVVIDGFQPSSPFHTNATGHASATASYPLPDVGSSFAYQSLLADPLSAYGYALTAAVSATVVHAATTQTLAWTTTTIIHSPVSFSFYGSAYSDIAIDSRGWISFGPWGGVGGAAANVAAFNFGPPRIAAFWGGQNSGSSPTSAVVTYDLSSTPTSPGFARLEYSTMPFVGFHPVSITLYTNGVIQISHAQNTSGQFVIVGITPGNNLSPAAKDLSSILSPNSYLGAINESFYEFFSNTGYDLGGKTLTFIPMGPGPLPQSTDRYLVY